MKSTPYPREHTAARAVGKRRYVRTAVEFPIRFDQIPYSQGVLRGFPSWERARRAPTYVSGHAIANYSLSNLPQQSMVSPYYHAAMNANTPTEGRQKSTLCADELPVRFMERTCLVPGSSAPEPNQVRPISLPIARTVLSLSFRIAREFRSTTLVGPLLLLSSSRPSPFLLPSSTLAAQTNLDQFNLRFARSSLGSYLKSFDTLDSLILYSFRHCPLLFQGLFLVRSWFDLIHSPFYYSLSI